MANAPDAEVRAAAGAVARAASDSEAVVSGLCARYPDDARTHFLLGALFEKSGRLEEALLCLDRALALDRDHVQAINAKATALSRLGKTHAARQLLADAASRQPNIAQLWVNLGIAEEALQDFEGALAAYDRALSINDAQHLARLNRGYVLSRLGKLQQALDNNQRLVDERPDDPSAHYNLAEALLAFKQYEKTLRACRTALHLAPGHAKAMIVSGLALSALGRLEEARQAFNAAKASDPVAVRDFVNPFDAAPSSDVDRFDPEIICLACAYEEFNDCNWQGRDASIEMFLGVVQARIAEGRPLNDQAVAYEALTLPISDALRLDIARNLSGDLVARAGANRRRASYRRLDRGGRLRVAYLSPDFREHLNAYLLTPLIEFHDRERFEVICYSSGPADASRVRERLLSASDKFVNVYRLDADAIVELILKDAIDILVDTGGFTTYARPDVLARKPAPVQVSFLGYPGTLGMRAVDYRITDRIATPLDQERYWTESQVFLPDTFFIYELARDLQSLPVLRRADYGLPDDAFVYCAFSNYYKIEPEVFGIWMQILETVPGSVLWLAGRNKNAVENLRREAKIRGVSAERLIFAPYEERNRYLARFALADLFLDTLIFNAMTTACDALAAGLPVLTCRGASFTSRVAASLLSAARFADGIAGSKNEYRSRATTWGCDPQGLRKIRRAKLSNLRAAPLFDVNARARQLEAAYLEMWRRYAQGSLPSSFEVSRKPATPPPGRWF